MDGQLLSFRVVNHRSLRDEQELSFIASATAKDDARLLHPAGIDEAVVPVCAMYGANASGKSNLMHALAFMQEVVLWSQRVWHPTEGVPRQPFALHEDRSAPSTFALQMMMGDVRYEYGFAVTDATVHEEWLFAWPNGRKQEWFTRDRQTFDFGRMLHGENKAIEALTRPNSLFLSAAAQNNHEQLRPVYEWFGRRLHVSREMMSWGAPSRWWEQFIDGAEQLTVFRPHDVDEAHLLRAQVCALLRAADLGIEDFRVTEDLVRHDGHEELRRRPPSYRLSFSHLGAAPGAWLDLAQESTGTRALVSLLPTLLLALQRGGVVAIDELNTLHPMLALALVQLFQDPRRNPRGAQLLFNTHESSLLGNLLADPPPLRRDQIWLTEKDRTGATHLIPLTDYKPRATENFERGYLQGRYGAVPFLGGFDQALPAAEK
ncbi:MAG: ATP-binding protein [Kofleriaceae bacterium]